ncbi:MAG: UDP-glucose 4-epimerase GalE [Chromatiales bacterium]|jgi:UDP-glucose 4-epimerase|nr:UDP-glucose 4-epimerase GalE [Chromatiales bacterium]
MKHVLVTGGLGYIGSHTAVELIAKGYEVILADNLFNTRPEVLDGIEAISGVRPEWINVNLSDAHACQAFLDGRSVDGIIHFAAHKAVGESMEQPLKYYQNNLGSLMNLLTYLRQHRGCAFIFSSSCTVYGQADTLPIIETAPVKPAESPYGNTKQIGEEIIRETAIADGLRTIALRYFNPIGAHKSARIGELPLGVPQNLVPFITQSAAGLRGPLQVYGNDYPTRDGTAIRDYIHVVDLAKAHIAAMERLLHGHGKGGMDVFNLGTGTGSTILEVIDAFERSTNAKLEWDYADRRAGDIIAAYADTALATRELGWTAKKTLDESMADAWRWQQSLTS